MKAHPQHAVILDRDRPFAGAVVDALIAAGFVADHASSIDDVPRSTDCVIVDPIALPSPEPRALLNASTRSPRELIVVAQYLDVAATVRWMRAGAADCRTKPIAPETVAQIAANCLSRRTTIVDLDSRQAPSIRTLAMQQLMHDVGRVADSRATLLIVGETGVGKSRLAHVIHQQSSRHCRPIVTIACGTLSPSLAGSELFGHVRGAFSDATRDVPGRLAAAEGGTLLLDEIDAAPPQLQLQLLRVLQERTYEPVGSSRTHVADVRFIATTSADLAALTRDGRFREDLYHRLNVITLAVPPLRDRRADLDTLVDCFLPSRPITEAARQAIHRYAWPGNVRELQHALERASLLSTGGKIDLTDLPPAVRVALQPDSIVSPLDATLIDHERLAILSALDRNGWSRQAAAADLGIERTTLYKKMRRLGLTLASRLSAA